MKSLKLQVLSDSFAVCRMDPSEAIPGWFRPASLACVAYTDEELSLTVPEGMVPDGIQAEKNWRAIKVLGPLDFALTGILASIAAPLADAKIPIFAISTFDTDYILIQNQFLSSARTILSDRFDLVN